MKEDKIKFGSIFSKSWEEYKSNFKESSKFVLLFLGLPALLLLIIEIVLLSVDPSLFSIMSSPATVAALEGTIKIPIYFRIISGFFTIVSIFFMVFVSAGFISSVLKKEKFSFRELVKNAKPRYWQYFGFCIVYLIFVFLLTLLLIIPGILFGIYWIFASYIFFDRKEKIRPSLKQSREIVKGRWWKTFGYSILLFLIVIGITLVIGIVQIPTTIIMTLHTLSGTPMPLGLLIAYLIMNFIGSLLGMLISVPLPTMFFKNFYREMEATKATPAKKVNKSRK
jgi:hypothetical protein